MFSFVFRRQPKPPKSSWSKKASRFLKWNSDKLPWFQKQKAIEDQNGVIEETVRRIFTPHLIKQLKHRHPLWTKVTFKWQQTLKRLLPIGGASEGNRITIYDTGDEAYKAMWSAIEQAKERVWLETYILDPDHIGKRFINGLVKAARSGCEVKLIYDYVGSSKLHTIHLKPLIEAGAEVVAFNPLITWPWKVKHWGFFRNHRKILVIDDKVAFTGGMNIGEQYASKNIGGNGYFRDTHVRIIGPAVHDLADVFLNSLKETRAYEITGGNGNGIDMEIDTDDDTKDIIPLTRYKQQKLNNKNNNKIKDGNKEDHVFVQILQSNVRRNKLHIQKAMRLTLNCASNNCYMSTPYFLPPQSLKKSLINAGKRGIDVRILTAGVSDVPMVRMASQHVYSVLLRNGIRIYEYFGATLHAKTATIDGIYSSIGSFNLDIWSHLYNLEINMSTLDHKTASQLEDQFMRDLQQSTEVTLADLESRSFIKRAMYWSAYHLLRIFDFKPFYSTVGIQKAIPVRTQTTDEHKSIEG